MANVKTYDVLGLGTVAIDDFLYVARFPAPDEKAEVLRKNRKLGGLIATALAAATRIGASCAYAGTLGRDEISRIVGDGLRAFGIDISHAVIDEGTSVVHSMTVVGESQATRNSFFHLPMKPLKAEQLDERIIGSARVLLVDQLGKEGIRYARSSDTAVVADMEWCDWPDVWEMIDLVDHLIVSRDFACTITGTDDPVKALKELDNRKKRECTALTLGRNGVYYLCGEMSGDVERIPAFQVNTVETTGCGDVFHGVYAACLARKEAIRKCLVYASAAAAIYASRPSGWEYLPPQTEIESLIDRSNCR
jgi:sulfofructose kinase